MVNKSLLTFALVAGVACAQTATPAAQKKSSAPVTPASQTVKTAAAKQAAKTTPAKTAAAAPKKTEHAKVQSPAKVKSDIETKVAKPSAEKPTEPVRTAGRRDPFVSPLRLQEDKMKGNALCTTGSKCLIVDQVVLKGIVKTPQGMIAMVENAAQKQYNLREKDPVYNGQVEKITGDSVIFRETVTDNLGHQTTREVVKKVTAPVL